MESTKQEQPGHRHHDHDAAYLLYPSGIILGLLTCATLKLLIGQRDKLSLSVCVMCVIFIAKFACL